MGQQYSELNDKLSDFITAQKIFFVGTAASGSSVNISPKGMDSLRVLGPKRVLWLNVTGSGNETAAHLLETPRMTLMFCAFEGTPMILRLYGTARAIHPGEPEWETLFAHFEAIPGSRQIFDMQIERVQTSCGMAVPFFDYREERDQLRDWSIKKGEEVIRQYWRDKNQFSIDGLPTKIIERNGL